VSRTALRRTRCLHSAGSEPADQVNPIAVQAMAEDGIDIAGETPKVLTTAAVEATDVVVTMGCGDTCPYYPGKRYEDWELEDPPEKTSTPSAASATTSVSESSSSSQTSPAKQTAYLSDRVHDMERLVSRTSRRRGADNKRCWSASWLGRSPIRQRWLLDDTGPAGS
jgi:hypothetical protein